MLVIVALDLAIILIGTAIPASRLNATLIPDVQHLTTVDVSTCTQHRLAVLILIHFLWLFLHFVIALYKVL